MNFPGYCPAILIHSARVIATNYNTFKKELRRKRRVPFFVVGLLI